MTTEECGDYKRGTTRWQSSSSLLKAALSTHTYAPLGTYGVRPCYSSSGQQRNNFNHRDHTQHEQRLSPKRRLTEDCTCTKSPQHPHRHTLQTKHIPLVHNNSSNQNNNDIRKNITPTSCISSSTPSLTQPRKNKQEGQTTGGVPEKTSTSSNKRPRCSSDDESGKWDDSRRHESKYDSRSSNYKPRITSRAGSSREEAVGSRDEHRIRDIDRRYHDPHYEQGKSRYNHDHRNGREDNGARSQHCDQPASDSLDIFCKKKLWVGGLPSDITCGEIRKYFEAFGKLIYVMISPKGNAFVKYSTADQAFFAYKQCYTAYIREKSVRVKYAIRKANKIPHNKLLYINNVPPNLTRTDLKKEFEKYGAVEDVQMFSVPYSYFFVTFELEACAVKARKALKTKYFIQFGKTRTDDRKSESPESAQVVKAPPNVQGMDVSECEVADVLESLSELQTQELRDLLNDLQPTNAAIRIRRDWILDHIAHANDILLHVSVMLVAKDNPFSLRLSTLFLIHDLLSYCTQRRVCSEILDTVSALTLPHLQRVISKFQVTTEAETQSVLNILSLWSKYNVFPVTVVEDLKQKFKDGEQGSHSDDLW